MIEIQQELVTLRHDDQCLGFYWPYGFDQVMIGSTYWNPKTQVHQFQGWKEAELYTVEEAHQIFNMLLSAGAY